MIFQRLKDVPPSKIRAVYAKAKPGFIDLGLGMPFCSTVEQAKAAAVGAIETDQTFYTPNAGSAELRAAIAARYGVTPESVLVTHGVAEGIFASLFALVQPGDEVLVPDPGYPAYGAVTRLAGGEAVTYPLKPENGFRLAADDLLDRLTPNTRAVVINSPSNPTGAVHSAEALSALARGLSRRSVAVISDEAYSRLSLTGSPVPSLLGRLPQDQLLTLSGVSKEFAMTGWRIGWIVSSPENIAQLVKGHLFMISCASSVSQAAALGALQSDDDTVMRIMKSHRQRMCDALAAIPGLTFDWPQGGIYCFVNVSRYGTADRVADDLLEKCNVVTVPGSGFGPGGRHYLRLSFGVRPQVIDEGVKRMADYFASQERSHA